MTRRPFLLSLCSVLASLLLPWRVKARSARRSGGPPRSLTPRDKRFCHAWLWSGAHAPYALSRAGFIVPDRHEARAVADRLFLSRPEIWRYITSIQGKQPLPE